MNLTLVIVWAALTVALIIFELLTVQFVAIWFATGSFLAFIASLFGVGPLHTIIIFIVGSILLLVCTRPIAKRLLNSKKTATNADSVIGEVGVVTERIDNIAGTGRITVNGLSWSARSNSSDVCFEQDAHCKILEIEGVKVIVTSA